MVAAVAERENHRICKKCGSPNVVLVEYPLTHPDHYDGVSEIMCREPECGARFGRWSENELEGDETEPRFGGED